MQPAGGARLSSAGISGIIRSSLRRGRLRSVDDSEDSPTNVELGVITSWYALYPEASHWKRGASEDGIVLVGEEDEELVEEKVDGVKRSFTFTSVILLH